METIARANGWAFWLTGAPMYFSAVSSYLRFAPGILYRLFVYSVFVAYGLESWILMPILIFGLNGD